MEKPYNPILKKTILITIVYTIFLLLWNIFVQEKQDLTAVLITLLTGLAVGVGLYFIYRWEYRRLMKKKGLEDEKK